MLAHGMMVLRGLIYTIWNNMEQTRYINGNMGYVWCMVYEYGKTTVCDMVCVDGMVREKHSTRYIVGYVCGMVPWYDVVVDV